MRILISLKWIWFALNLQSCFYVYKTQLINFSTRPKALKDERQKENYFLINFVWRFVGRIIFVTASLLMISKLLQNQISAVIMLFEQTKLK